MQQENSNMVKANIYLAADHAGYKLKEISKKYLQENYKDKYTIIDCGADELVDGDDYTVYMHKAAQMLNANPESKAIVFGGSGNGEAMVMNKYKNIRCGVYYGDTDDYITNNNLNIINLMRAHNDANAISIGARFICNQKSQQSVKDIVEKIVDSFLNTDFEGGRHLQRVKNI
jgi:ribose 5-phosphate isomerase B